MGFNYGRKVLCPLCKLHEDNQEGVLNCVVIKLNCKELYAKKDEKYEDIFSSDLEKLNKISRLFQKCLDTRAELLEEQKKQLNL